MQARMHNRCAPGQPSEEGPHTAVRRGVLVGRRGQRSRNRDAVAVATTVSCLTPGTSTVTVDGMETRRA